MERKCKMFIQHCFEPTELKILRSLNPRIELLPKDKHQLYSLKKGYGGEKKFENEWLKKLTCECFIINSLLLEYNSNVFQIDSLVITQKTIYLFDVKNYVDDFYIKDGIWYLKSSEKEIKDPILQLTRCESLFRRILQELRIQSPIETNLVFINPQFTLYQAPIELTAIFPTQIQRYMQAIENSPSKLNGTHSKLVDQLIAKQLDEAKYARYPDYEYDLLKKGVSCNVCDKFMKLNSSKSKFVCLECGETEDFDSAVMGMVRQFQLLFPNRKMTTNGLAEWCGIPELSKGIRRVLNKNFKLTGHGKCSYFV